MSDSPSKHDSDAGSYANLDPNPPTIAAFSPANLSHTSTKRSTILVHQKSPLLLATPPQITRALAYSHPFVLPLNKVLGLLTWTTGDPWESFLLLVGFWTVTLYGDVIMRCAGPVVVVVGLIMGMYARRYSPLSSSGWTGAKQSAGHSRQDSEATNTKHQKTLDEIVETLRTFTARCNIILDPLLELTDFLSTQRTATTATTRPALTILLLRIMLLTPLWYGLTLQPIAIITTKRCAIVTGTIFITWHSRPNRVARAILWRSALVRRFSSAVTGLHLTDNLTPPSATHSESGPPLPPRPGPSSYLEALQAVAKRRPSAPGVKFTFIIYENQRRWIGLGWTTSLFAYERASWTDEYLNAVPAKEDFELPDVDEQDMRWRWVPDGQWLVEGASEFEEGGAKAKEGTTEGGQGWIYYDNKWQNGRRGQDGWGRYTRRRKWYRDAELVELTASTRASPPRSETPTPNMNSPVSRSITSHPASQEPLKALPNDYISSSRSDAASMPSSSVGSSHKGHGAHGVTHSTGSATGSSYGTSSSGFGGRRKRGSRASSIASDEDARDRLVGTGVREREEAWGIGDDLRMSLE